MSESLKALFPTLFVLAVALGAMWWANRRGTGELVGSAARRMARLKGVARSFCREEIAAVVLCNLDGEPSGVSLPHAVKQAADEMGLGVAIDSLPSPVLLAVSDRWVYAFHCRPGLLGVKIKRELTRWPRDGLEVRVVRTYSVAYLVLGTDSDASHVFEVGSLHVGPARQFNAFVAALGEEV